MPRATAPIASTRTRLCVDMVARVARRFGLKPKRLAADTAYGNAATLKTLVAHGIEPHIPVIDKSARNDGTFSRAEFQYDRERDLYICPGGKELTTSGTAHDGTTYKYLAKRRRRRDRPRLCEASSRQTRFTH